MVTFTLAVSVTAAPAEAQRADQARSGAVGRAEWLTAAAFVVGTAAVWPADQRVRDWAQAPSRQGSATRDALAAGFNAWGQPGSVAVPAAVWLAGRMAGDRATSAVGLRAGEAVFVSGVATYLGKVAFGRARPWRSPDDPRDFAYGRGTEEGYTAFPSGHATAAFAMAAALSEEWRRHDPRRARVAAPVLYALAAGTAWARLHDDKHWVSDVVAGAGVGTLSGLMVVRWHARHPGSRVDRWLLPAAR